jgi:hypothetical protein
MPGEPPDTGCWEWTGYRRDDGYGQMRHGGKNRLAHIVAYEVLVGSVPEGEELRHICHNPPCCHPHHLIPGTHLQNMQDMAAAGRSRHGVDSSASKLDEIDVALIRSIYTGGRHTQRDLALMFSVHTHTIRDILRRKTWDHVHALVE